MKARALILPILFLALFPFIALSQTAEELQQQIDDQSGQIKALDDEIAKYEKELAAVADKKETLQSTISGLDIQIKKLNAEIKKTKTQISSTQAQITKLSGNIVDKQTSIKKDMDALTESLRQLDQNEDVPFAVAILSNKTISDAWEEADVTRMLQTAVSANIEKLSTEKSDLENTKKQTEDKKATLVKQQNSLVSQQGSLSAVKTAQSDLLKQTKAQESNYQDLIAQKKAAKLAFESALSNLKSKLQFVIDPNSIPQGGKGILQWPLDSVRITQYFGNTAFALAGAYNGKGHNGIDLAARIGTPIKAALAGMVVGTGNTDATRGCYSFGKWVMVTHSNGLSTMYAHLSQIAVSSGQAVETGQILGYSGETGYATGPHLHFGVYLTSATQIMKLGDATQSKTSCANAVMPVTPLAGYLNPMNYL